VIGLLEYLDARGGKEEIFRIAQDTHYEFGRMLEVVEAGELLNFVDTPKRLVVLEPEGRRFVQAGSDERKALWREQLLKLRIVHMLQEALRRQPGRAVTRDDVLELLILWLPQENYERLFHTLLTWGRYGNLFGYDEARQILSLQEG